MTDLTNALAVFGRPYAITRSRLGAITKVYDDQYICDIKALQELLHTIGEKLGSVAAADTHRFSFLISFSDHTHHDGMTKDLLAMSAIPIGKRTDRVVARWSVLHQIDSVENELSITVRISNPVNPLVFLQAALSKSPADIDNLEFELGSTCVTVDGAVHGFADEVFLRVQAWLDARAKPHSFLPVYETYSKYEWYLDRLTDSVLPLLAITGLSLWVATRVTSQMQMTFTPPLVGLFIVSQTLGRRLNSKAGTWARNAQHVGLFQLTNGDNDALAKQVAKANNSAVKLIVSTVGSFLLNILAGLLCWWITKS